jgi:hypothetical protein
MNRQDELKDAHRLTAAQPTQTTIPDLEGSEKQIEWARSIRAKFLNDCDRTRVEYPEWVFKNHSAKWWIENRYDMGRKRPLPKDIIIF